MIIYVVEFVTLFIKERKYKMKEALEKIKNIKEFISTELNNIHNLNDCNELRIKYLSKKGMIGELLSLIHI